jgi:hypothetical protein
MRAKGFGTQIAANPPQMCANERHVVGAAVNEARVDKLDLRTFAEDLRPSAYQDLRQA